MEEVEEGSEMLDFPALHSFHHANEVSVLRSLEDEKQDQADWHHSEPFPPDRRNHGEFVGDLYEQDDLPAVDKFRPESKSTLQDDQVSIEMVVPLQDDEIAGSGSPLDVPIATNTSGGRKKKNIFKRRKQIFKFLFILAVPLVCLPILLIDFGEEFPNAHKMLYAAAIMALYWIFELLPIAITAFVPIFLYPILGIMSAEKISPVYFNDTIFLFIEGYIMAKSMEKWRLHERIALTFLVYFGSRVFIVFATFMLITAFLSMWISNTSTTLLMV